MYPSRASSWACTTYLVRNSGSSWQSKRKLVECSSVSSWSSHWTKTLSQVRSPSQQCVLNRVEANVSIPCRIVGSWKSSLEVPGKLVFKQKGSNKWYVLSLSPRKKNNFFSCCLSFCSHVARSGAHPTNLPWSKPEHSLHCGGRRFTSLTVIEFLARSWKLLRSFCLWQADIYPQDCPIEGSDFQEIQSLHLKGVAQPSQRSILPYYQSLCSCGQPFLSSKVGSPYNDPTNRRKLIRNR